MPPMSRPRRPGQRPPLPRGARRGALLVAALAGAASLGGCSLPTTTTPPPATDPSEAPVASSTPDPARVALVTELEDLQATITAAREAFAGAIDATPAAAADAAEATLELLIAEVAATDADHGDGPRPLFPAETLDRDEAGDAADQLTATLTVARDVGGTLGNTVVDLLRDPIAGDLGAWQRDAAGVLASIDETVASATSLEEQELAIGELPGLGTRAIAWARLTTEAASTEDATAYAERGVANLEVIEVTLADLELAP